MIQSIDSSNNSSSIRLIMVQKQLKKQKQVKQKSKTIPKNLIQKVSHSKMKIYSRIVIKNLGNRICRSFQYFDLQIDIVNVKKRSRFRSGRRRVPKRLLNVITTEKTSMQTTQYPNNIISMEDLTTQRPKPLINVISMGDLIKQQILNSPIGITHDLFGNPINKIEEEDDTSVTDDEQSEENPMKRIYRSYLDKNYHVNGEN